MEFTDLSLGIDGDSKQINRSMKRKWDAEDQLPQSDVDLQLQRPLPSFWEQCLDLQSGRMYYVNRRTSKKMWSRPKEQEIDLELSMFTGSCNNRTIHHHQPKHSSPSNNRTISNMVALACSNCHLLVILSRSSPACPNCKFIHQNLNSPDQV